MGDFLFSIGRGELKRGEEAIKLTERERDLMRHVRPTSRPPHRAPRIVTRRVDRQRTRHRCSDQPARRKIETDPSNPVYLQTVRGKGYILYTD